MLRPITDDRQRDFCLQASCNCEVDTLPGDLTASDDEILMWARANNLRWEVRAVGLVKVLREYALGLIMGRLWRGYLFVVEKLCAFCGKVVRFLWKSCGEVVEKWGFSVDNSLFLVDKLVDLVENFAVSTGGAMMTALR